MFGEQISGQFGRIILLTGRQRGGPDGGPVCRFLLDGRTGVLLDIGRIDCFAIEPHHHTQGTRYDAAFDCPQELRIDLAERKKRLNREEWERCAEQSVAWLENDFTRQLAEMGWGSWVIEQVEAVRPELAAEVRRFLLTNPPGGLAT